MVKIRVTGETTFEWMEAIYNKNYPEKCGKQSEFDESCFQGVSVEQDKYDLTIKAMRRNKGRFDTTINKLEL